MQWSRPLSSIFPKTPVVKDFLGYNGWKAGKLDKNKQNIRRQREQWKKTTLHVQHTFLYISLPLFCTTTTWNFQKRPSYMFYGGNIVRILDRLPFVRKFRWKLSVKWYWYFFGTENGNGTELYHLQNTGKFFAFSRHKSLALVIRTNGMIIWLVLVSLV